MRRGSTYADVSIDDGGGALRNSRELVHDTRMVVTCCSATTSEPTGYSTVEAGGARTLPGVSRTER